MQLDPFEGEYKEAETKLHRKMSDTKGSSVTCPNCSNKADAKDINIHDKIAKCGSCHQIFSFQHVLKALFSKPSTNQKPIVGNQVDIDVFEYKGELNISVVDFTDWLAIIAMSIGSILFFAAMVSLTGGTATIGVPLMFSSLSLFAGAIYRFIKYRENKMHIDVDDQYLHVQQIPRLLYKNKRYLRSNIRQFYSKTWADSGNKYYHLYMLYNGPEGEEHIKVTPYLRSRSRALYLEQELENFMGIPDERVPEETLVTPPSS